MVTLGLALYGGINIPSQFEMKFIQFTAKCSAYQHCILCINLESNLSALCNTTINETSFLMVLF